MVSFTTRFGVSPEPEWGICRSGMFSLIEGFLSSTSSIFPCATLIPLKSWLNPAFPDKSPSLSGRSRGVARHKIRNQSPGRTLRLAWQWPFTLASVRHGLVNGRTVLHDRLIVDAVGLIGHLAIEGGLHGARRQCRDRLSGRRVDDCVTIAALLKNNPS